jgi:hypothetical protein
MSSEIDVRGVFLPLASPDENKEAHDYLYDALERYALKPFISKEFELEEASVSHDYVMNPINGGATGKVVIVMDK